MSIKINENSFRNACNHLRLDHYRYIPDSISLPKSMEVYRWRYGKAVRVAAKVLNAPDTWKIQEHDPTVNIYYPGHWDATTITRVVRNLVDCVEFDKTIDLLEDHFIGEENYLPEPIRTEKWMYDFAIIFIPQEDGVSFKTYVLLVYAWGDGAFKAWKYLPVDWLYKSYDDPSL